MGTDPSLSFIFLTKPKLSLIQKAKELNDLRRHKLIWLYLLSHYHQNQRLIHCVLSGSDVWRQLGLLYSPTSNNKTPALLTRHCCYSCSSAEKMTDFLQLAEDGNMLARDSSTVHQWSWEGPKQYDIILS